jgi:YebC/PmpR family DNA-binding regulatory protein
MGVFAAGVTMSGHSKWSTIKHKKAKEDSKRGKVFTKLVREITVAAREGGGDPAGNAKLRLILDKAKEVNMPLENVTRAIKKGTGELDGGAAYEPFTYEGYGPHGIAVMVETLSDNKNRTVSDLRHQFSRTGGNLGESGSVAWMFEHKGVLRAPTTISEDDLLEKLMEAPLEDLQVEEGMATVTCKTTELDVVKKAVEGLGLKVEAAQMEWVAKNPVPVAAGEQEEAVFKFLEALDDLDDVQNVYANVGD